MNHPHKRKRIVLRLTPEQLSDPQSILDATRAVLREKALVLEVRTASPPPPEPIPLPEEPPTPQPEPRSSLTHLQAAAFDHAAAVLREKSDAAKAAGTPARFDWKAWWGRAEAVGAFFARNKDYVVSIWERATR